MLNLAVDCASATDEKKGEQVVIVTTECFQDDPRQVCIVPRVPLLVDFMICIRFMFHILPKEILDVHAPALSYIGNCPFRIKDHIESSFYDVSDL